MALQFSLIMNDRFPSIQKNILLESNYNISKKNLNSKNSFAEIKNRAKKVSKNTFQTVGNEYDYNYENQKKPISKKHKQTHKDHFSNSSRKLLTSLVSKPSMNSERNFGVFAQPKVLKFDEDLSKKEVQELSKFKEQIDFVKNRINFIEVSKNKNQGKIENYRKNC